MKFWLRLVIALATGLVAWIAVYLFVTLVTPKWDDLTPGIVWFPAVICGPLALSRRSLPLLVSLAGAVGAFAFGCFLSYTASPGDDGAGMAAVLLIMLATLFVAGAILATATHWGLVRLHSLLFQGRGEKAA